MLYIISKNIKCYCIKIKIKCIKCIKSLNVRHDLKTTCERNIMKYDVRKTIISI